MTEVEAADPIEIRARPRLRAHIHVSSFQIGYGPWPCAYGMVVVGPTQPEEYWCIAFDNDPAVMVARAISRLGAKIAELANPVKFEVITNRDDAEDRIKHSEKWGEGSKKVNKEEWIEARNFWHAYGTGFRRALKKEGGEFTRAENAAYQHAEELSRQPRDSRSAGVVDDDGGPIRLEGFE